MSHCNGKSKIPAGETRVFFPFARSRSIFRYQRETDYQQCPKRGLGTPKSHTRKKRLLYTVDFRVIYTSYLFSGNHELRDAMFAVGDLRPMIIPAAFPTRPLARFLLRCLFRRLINELLRHPSKQLTRGPLSMSGRRPNLCCSLKFLSRSIAVLP